ncbi:hypothetical protein BD777DRAFT_131977 [Yarrowia lipolytica]|nr:hypothetical protein BD777DRAFT_131977 [Yarrowia lipolytica]
MVLDVLLYKRTERVESTLLVVTYNQSHIVCNIFILCLTQYCLLCEELPARRYYWCFLLYCTYFLRMGQLGRTILLLRYSTGR